MHKGLESANVRIKALRQALQLTRVEFCEKTGLKVTTLENIEKTKQKVHDEHFQAIAKVWPEYTYWLVTGDDPSIAQIPPALVGYIKKLKNVEDMGMKNSHVESMRKEFIKDSKRKID